MGYVHIGVKEKTSVWNNASTANWMTLKSVFDVLNVRLAVWFCQMVIFRLSELAGPTAEGLP